MRPEGIPCAGAENGLFWYILHKYWDAQHSSQCDQVGTYVPIAQRSMVGTPMIHHRIYISEGTMTIEARDEPGGRPTRVCALVQDAVHFIGQVNDVAFGQLQGWPQTVYQV